ncbi:MFS transporter [Ruegeria sp. Alg231-54]|uniref:MFS transporter n=1 Tax=Ruegeria sp. Alg231-54 TaxID=1922221 RepID=UPI000D55F5FC|nr:MFS transporter [Ruegeria sp. Alg231-54]
MIQVLSSAWALLLGMGLLMVGNGLQGTILGVRGEIEGFSTLQMSFVMSAYFVGFLGGSRLAPEMIRRVGHVRVFAALASFISAVMIMYPLMTDPVIWILGRVVIGFCFSGVYVTAESWLNNAASNENRGQALSLYMIFQMTGIISAQGLVLLGDPAGFDTFVIASILVSVSFAPILLSISPTPAFDTTKPMTLRELFGYSPLGCVGMFLLGGVFSAQFGMASVYGARAGLTLVEISTFIAAFYIGALVLQYPLGWMSDRMDRRFLIMLVAGVGSCAAFVGLVFGVTFPILLGAAFVIGGMSNPLYSLLIAHANDFLEHEDMAAASGGLLFINGMGAIAGPLITGWLMGDAVFGPPGFFLFIAILLVVMAGYSLYRMTQRAAIPVDETGTMSPLYPTASPVVMELAQELAIEAAEAEQETQDVA